MVIESFNDARKAKLTIFSKGMSSSFFLHNVFFFFFEPHSSDLSFQWNSLLSFFSLIRILSIAVESCDGPNQYVGREDKSIYPFLLTDQSYWILEMCLMFPLLFDTVARTGVVLYLYIKPNELRKNFVRKELFGDSFRLLLWGCDICGVIPFFVSLVYLRPNKIYTNSPIEVVTVLCSGRLLRVLKHVPAIWAVRLALANSLSHLVLPIFLFFVFNITTATIFYFAEPCYISERCPWQSLFDSTFYSVVTMSTTGYGNQIPSLELGRCLACLSMIFGAIYLSFPLAIIGNEYEAAWSVVSAQVAASKVEQSEKEAEIELLKLQEKMPLSADEMVANLPIESTPTDGTQAITPLNNLVASISNRKSSISSPRKASFFSSNFLKTGMSAVSPEPFSPSAISLSLVGNKDKVIREIVDDSSDEGSNGPGALITGTPNSEVFCSIEAFNLMQETMRSAENDASDSFTALLLLSVCQLSAAIPSLVSGIQRTSAKILSTVIEEKNSSYTDRRASFLSSRLAKTQQRDIEEEENNKDIVRPPVGVDTKPRRGRLSIIGHVQPRPLSTGIIQPASPEMNLGFAGGNVSQHRKSETKEEELLQGIKAQGNDHCKGNNTASKLVHSLKTYINTNSAVSIHNKQLNWCEANPDSVRAQAWLMLERPESSSTARVVQYLLISFICLSILVLFTETLTSWTQYGETTSICQKVVHFYCSDKDSYGLDKGCFVKDEVNTKLRFFCSDDDCFGFGGNFGSSNSTLSCTNPGETIFQQEDTLVKHYGYPSVFTTQEKNQIINPICSRIECIDDTQIFNGELFWLVAEVLVNGVFTIELIIRVSLAWSLHEYLSNWSNWLDVLGVLPFYLDVIIAASSIAGLQNFSFAIIASSPEPTIINYLRACKVFRLFKLIRHFKSTQVLFETTRRAWKQLAAIIGLLMFIITVFAVLLFELEGGTPCFVGDEGCHVPEADLEFLNVGQHVYINKNGDISAFKNVFYAIWFSLVTLTTTGYGDFVPVTNSGLVMAVFIMLFGAIYMAMPLTVSATTFCLVHELYQENKHKMENDSDDDSDDDVLMEDQGDVNAMKIQSVARRKSSLRQTASRKSSTYSLKHKHLNNIISIIASHDGRIRAGDKAMLTEAKANEFVNYWAENCLLCAMRYQQLKRALDVFLVDIQLSDAMTINDATIDKTPTVDSTPPQELTKVESSSVDGAAVDNSEYYNDDSDDDSGSVSSIGRQLFLLSQPSAKFSVHKKVEVVSSAQSSDSSEAEDEIIEKYENPLVVTETMRVQQRKSAAEAKEDFNFPKFCARLSSLEKYLYLVKQLSNLHKKCKIMLNQLRDIADMDKNVDS